MMRGFGELDDSRTKARLLFLSLTIVVLDQWSKWLVEVYLDGSGVVPIVPGFVNLIHVTNTGVAFGLFPTGGQLLGTLLLTSLGFSALCVVGLYFWRTSSTERLLLLSLALILGGAVGNLVDRLMKGSVTDFIDLYVASHHWPTFNAADSAISIGIALMAIETLRPRRSRASASQELA